MHDGGIAETVEPVIQPGVALPVACPGPLLALNEAACSAR
jgi:hypothetical protein